MTCVFILSMSGLDLVMQAAKVEIEAIAIVGVVQDM